MNKSSKPQNPWLIKSRKTRANYPKIHIPSSRSIGVLKGGFDRSLLHLGVAFLEEEPQVVEK